MKHIQKLFHFVKPYWRNALLALFLLTSLVFLDLAIPRLVQQIIDQGIRQNNLDVVLQTAAAMVAISLVSTLIAIGNNIFSIRVGESVARDLREAVFLKIQAFSYADLDRHSTGRLMVRLTSDTGSIQRLVQISLRIGTRAPLLMVGSLILMFNTSPQLALTLLPVLIITMGVIVFFSLKMEPLYRSVQQKLDGLNTVLQENLAGARLVKAFGRAGREGERFELANEDLTERSVKVMQFMSSMSPVLTVMVNLGMVLVIWSGGLQVAEGGMTTGQLVAFTNYLLTTMNPLIMMTMLSNVWANGFASAQRINEILDTVPQVQERHSSPALPGGAPARVEFENVSFRYQGSNLDVLDGISLEAEPGQTVAILGATGAGKSTLVNLIPRFYDPTAGRVLIDGVDVSSLQQDSLLAQVGIVPQETILFSGSVADNIRYGRPEASLEEVRWAAQAAQADDFINRLPQGYATHIEERGVNLSGGQKQRIAIARALLTRPRILILDDSTSSVDIETETQIQAALAQSMAGVTSFVVAQRISTVLNAGQILVIEKGKIAARGTHSQLIQSSPIYQEIYESQLGGGFSLPVPAAEVQQ